jgi:hypothetical protein
LLQFGECKTFDCPKRHIVNEINDKPQYDITNGSLIKFKLQSIETPTCFVIKIEEHIANGKWTQINNSSDDILTEMQNYCENGAHLTEDEIRLGDICAKYHDKLETFVRGRIVEKT